MKRTIDVFLTVEKTELVEVGMQSFINGVEKMAQKQARHFGRPVNVYSFDGRLLMSVNPERSLLA